MIGFLSTASFTKWKGIAWDKKCHFALARTGWSVRNKSVRIDYWACLQTGPLYPLLLNQVAAITQSSGIQWLLGHGCMREEKSAMELFTLPPHALSLAPRTRGVDNEGSCESSSSVSTHQSFGITIAISWGVPGWRRTRQLRRRHMTLHQQVSGRVHPRSYGSHSFWRSTTKCLRMRRGLYKKESIGLRI